MLYHIDISATIPQLFSQNELKSDFQSWSSEKKMYSSNLQIYFEIVTLLNVIKSKGHKKDECHVIDPFTL